MWRWQGIVGVILALGVTGTLIIFAVTGAVNHRVSPLNMQEASALTTVLGATIGALAVFLGGSRGNRPDPPRPPEPPRMLPMLAPPEPPEPPSEPGGDDHGLP